MVKKNYFLFLLILFCSINCTKFSWNNPFDPDCPKELFSPSNLIAIQEGLKVKLTWNQSNTQISGIRVERIEISGSSSIIANLGNSANSYVDETVSAAKKYIYTIYAVAGDNKSNSVQCEINVQQVSLIDISTGLIAYYPFNGNANDVTGNAKNVIVIGAGLTNDRFGNQNTAYIFNGSSYINTNNIGIIGNNKRTVSFWAKTNSQIGGQEMAAVSWGTGNIIGERFDAFFNFQVKGATANIAGAAVTYNTIFDLGDNKWHFYIFIIDVDNAKLSDIKIYQDGILLTQIIGSYGLQNTPVNTSSVMPIYIGRSVGDGSPCYFNGSIDEVRIYNRALTLEQISYLSTN